MPLTYLVCVPCKRVSDLVEDYVQGEVRGEWRPFRQEHEGAEHQVFIGQSIGK